MMPTTTNFTLMPWSGPSIYQHPTFNTLRDSVLSQSATMIALVGPYRSGKTSLLTALRDQTWESPFKVTYRSLGGLNINTRDELANALSGKSYKRLLKEVRKENVFLLDSIAALRVNGTNYSDDVLWGLRALSALATFVYSSTPGEFINILDAFSKQPGSHYYLQRTIEVQPLEQKEVLNFLTKTSKGAISSETAQWIFDLCDGWPFYLQIMGEAVTLWLMENPGSTLTREKVKSLYEGHVLLSIRSSIFQKRWNDLPKDCKRILLRSTEQRPKFEEFDPTTVTLFRNHGLYDRSGLGGWLKDPPFFDWIHMNRKELTSQLQGT